MKIKHLLASLVAAFTISVTAQSPENPWKVSLGTNGIDFYERLGFEYQIGNNGVAFENDLNVAPYLSYLEVSRYLTKGISVNLGGTLNQVARTTGDDDFYYSIDAGVALSANSFVDFGKLEPVFLGGVGVTSIDNDAFPTANVGVGLSYWFNDSFALSLQAKRKVFSRDLNDMFDINEISGDYVNQYTVGVSFSFGDGDADEDGVKDSVDACPNTPGSPLLDGCPDDDGDGIRNGDDDCPNAPGIAALNGCPDGDQDGIADKDDACPAAAGPAALGGCPDADGDGLADKDDNCPQVAGPKANSGCPWPDADGDGIADKDDACPDVAGVAANNGCPQYPLSGLAALSVKFASENSDLDADAEAQLAEAYKIIDSNSGAKISIEGHADSTGPKSYNNPLSERRAAAVKAHLVAAGIDADRLSTVGHGESMPAAKNNTKAGRAENRRVEFTVVE